MKKYLLLAFIPFLLSCNKDKIDQFSSLNKEADVYTSLVDGTLVYNGDVKAIEYTKNIIENIPSTKEERFNRSHCFSKEEIKQCKDCIYNNSIECKRFDWVTTYTTKPDFIDYSITMNDWKYMKSRECNKVKSSLKIVLYDDQGNEIPDFTPSVQPFLNEACNTAWDNLSFIRYNNQQFYFTNLPDYTSNINDVDKSRFTFIYQVRSPYPDEEYMILQVGWKMLPVSDYGNLSVVCSGQQELRIIVYDELTNSYFINNQVVRAVVLCNNQEECNQGYEIFDIEYTDNSTNYNFFVN